MLLLCPVFDDLAALYTFEWTTPVIFDIAISCLLALGVNITNYLVLGKTSPLTYQVVGHLKTIFTISFGILILHHETNMKNLVGVSASAIERKKTLSSPRAFPADWNSTYRRRIIHRGQAADAAR